MDKQTIIKMLTGTVARGVMWAFVGISGMIGIQCPEENVVTGVAAWLVAGILAIGAILWSKWKDKKNLETPLPK